MEASTTSTETLPKFSRYRTVRQRAATLQTLSSQSDAEAPPPPLPKASTFAHPDTEAPVKRAPSRYRRNNHVTPVASPPLPAGPLPKIEHATAHVLGQAVTSPSRYHKHGNGYNERSPTHAQPATFAAHPVEARHRADRKLTERSGSVPRQPHRVTAEDRYEQAREEARLILEGEYDRLKKMKRQAEKQRQVISKSADLTEPDLARRRTSKHRDGKTVTAEPQPVPQVVAQEEPVLESEHSEPVIEVPTTPKQIFKKLMNHASPHSKPRQSPPKTRNEQPNFHNDNHAVTTDHAHPQTAFDAPVSAVNAGDRRVRLLFNTSEITLPITPSTTAKDLLNSASIVLSSSPDPRTATLLEAFVTEHLYLERPIRRYERIRDILNSWDSDSQNHLIILSGDSNNSNDNDHAPSIHGLDLKDVPSTAGRDITLQMHHSSRPAHWSKRWIRLREDGQISVSKSASGLDSTNICHLSDFDLYAPTKSMIKRLRPPHKKAVLFAVKSQQKSAMFLNDDTGGSGGKGKLNYAHFFCSPNKEVADQWYAAVHGWRSWYLVNVMGEGRVPAMGTGETIGERADELKRPGTGTGTGTKARDRASQETVPYQLGSFKPLLDFAAFENSATSAGEDSEGPVKRSVDLNRRSAGGEGRPNTGGSGAGRAGGGGGGGSPKRTHTVRGNGNSGGTPPTAFPSRFALDPTSDTTTGAGNTLPTQQSDPASVAVSGFTGRGLLASAGHVPPNPFSTNASSTTNTTANDPPNAFEDPNAAFTGRGLLARSATQRSQGGRGTGRGVSGVQGQPLVDMSAMSEFRDGSLLRRLEEWRGV